MITSHQPVLKDLVLIGGGHSHVMALLALQRRPLSGLQITLICTDTHTPYSGMLPGYVAGHYGLDDVHIDLGRLCVATGARLIRARVTGIDRVNRRVLCEGRPSLPYDLLSINTGSTPRLDGVPGAREFAVPVKPIARFEQRWQAVLARVRHQANALRVVVVGGGAGGVEMTLAMQHRLQAIWRERGLPESSLQFTLVSATPTLMPTHPPRVRQRFADVLRQRGVDVRLSRRVVAVAADHVALQLPTDSAADASTIETLPSDLTLWVTQAGGPAWLAQTGLALDEAGFVRVNAQLQSVTDPNVFAAGDVAHFEPRPLEKAGVFAVRMGAVLGANLRRALLAQPLLPYRPQRHWLALISTGDRHAVASWGPIGFWGDAVWRWKDRIDRRFMRMADAATVATMRPSLWSRWRRTSAETLPLPPEEQAQALSALAMRCGGCGAKVGPDILSRALADLGVMASPDVLVGLDAPDDAALVRVPPGMVSVQTVDFFRAFIDDPFVFGQIAAQHALGDLHAMGAKPHTALAIVTVPPGLNRQTTELLRQVMSGAVAVLNEAGCALVGGHSGEGQELALGFALTGLLPHAAPEPTSSGSPSSSGSSGSFESVDSPDAKARSVTFLRKGGLQAGQALILTKPLGTGTLLVAHALAQARGRWVDAALASMRQSSAEAGRILMAHGAKACTDVTGFGLAGHLLEMTRASGVDAELRLADLPVLDGALECLRAGHFSSLHASNRSPLTHLADALDGPRDRIELLFDPQTSGGLLAGVPVDQMQDCLTALHRAGYAQAAVIGRVVARGSGEFPFREVSGSGGGSGVTR